MDAKRTTISLIEIEKRKYWKQAHLYFNQLKKVTTSIRDVQALSNIIDNDLKWLLSHKIKNRHKYILIVTRAKRRIETLFNVLFSQAEESQELYLNRFTKIGNYRYFCRFNITPSNIEQIKGYNLLEEYGWYNSTTNPNGVVKDHRVSVKFGYENSIDHSIIGNIKNCEFLLFSDNARKSSKNSISISELISEINAIR